MVTPKTVITTSCIREACRPGGGTAIAASAEPAPAAVRMSDRAARALYLIDAMRQPLPRRVPIVRRKLLQFAVAAAAMFAVAPSLAQVAQFPTAELTIVTAKGPHKFTVELATTPPQLEQGLMFRQSMAADSGMLFDFKAPQPAM